MTIVGKDINAWDDARWQVQLESGESADTVCDPCWPWAGD
jgi:hypothetical protein